MAAPVLSRKGVDAALMPGPMPPSTCMTSWRAVYSSRATTSGEFVCATLICSGTQLSQPTVPATRGHESVSSPDPSAQ